jgi:putative restriction endonuclease
MREVAPGDLILSFRETRIRRIGIAQSYAYECPKPPEFGAAGPNWEDIGWKVDVRYVDPIHVIRPADHMSALGPLLPAHYSPLQADGRGLQSVYLTQVPEPLMHAFARIIGPLISPAAHRPPLDRMGLQHGARIDVGSFSEGQRQRLEFHRDRVFLEARVRHC